MLQYNEIVTYSIIGMSGTLDDENLLSYSAKSDDNFRLPDWMQQSRSSANHAFTVISVTALIPTMLRFLRFASSDLCLV